MLTVIIPSYNEVEWISQSLVDLLDSCDRKGWRVIIVDDGSTDGSNVYLTELHKNKRLQYVRHRRNRGYGAAIKSGIRAAISHYVVTVDADGQHRLEDVEALLKMAVENDADMVVGQRANSSGWFRALGKTLIRQVALLMMRFSVKDLNSGMKLYRRDLGKKYIKLCPDSMAFSDILTLIFINRNCQVLECPITINQRTTGRSKIRVKTAFETVYEIFNIIMLFSPFRIFFPISMIFLGLGCVWGIPLLVLGHGVSTGMALCMITGVLCLLLGLIAEQISLLRKESIE